MRGIVYLVLSSLQILQIVSKIDLTAFGRNHDIIYDYQAAIHGTGNQSEVVF